MENFNTYISEIRTLKMKSVEKSTKPAYCTEYNREYSEKLENLLNLGLEDLKWLSKEAIKQRLIFINRLERQFLNFDAYYPQLLSHSREGLLSETELFERLAPIFDFIRFDCGSNSEYFLICLNAIILSKHHSLMHFKNKTEDLLLEKILKENKWERNSQNPGDTPRQKL
jgi:hypothetical protein